MYTILPWQPDLATRLTSTHKHDQEQQLSGKWPHTMNLCQESAVRVYAMNASRYLNVGSSDQDSKDIVIATARSLGDRLHS